jgi:hypothetical protein
MSEEEIRCKLANADRNYPTAFISRKEIKEEHKEEVIAALAEFFHQLEVMPNREEFLDRLQEFVQKREENN